MAESTEIAWTDSTFNPWWGCTKIAPGCDNCYAAALDKRTGGNHWTDNNRRVLSEHNWIRPRSWQRKSAAFHAEHGHRRRVFSGSMCDVFDNKAPAGQRDRLWELIRQTPDLDWQLLTKRPTNIKRYLPDDWAAGYPNVWLGVTVENQEYGFPRIEALQKIPAKIRFLSCEPLLEELGAMELSGISWVIVGGESGPLARVMRMSWAAMVQSECRWHGIPFFFKQRGAKRGKGGCIIGGGEHKEWPEEAA